LEKYDTLQNTRTTTAATFNDATRHWSLNSGDRTHTVGGSLDLLELLPRIDVRATDNHVSETRRGRRLQRLHRIFIAASSPLRRVVT
jgi:hypothetical protein